MVVVIYPGPAVEPPEGNRPTYQMQDGIHLVPGRNEIPDEAVADRLLQSGLVRSPGPAELGEPAGPEETSWSEELVTTDDRREEE